MSEYKVEDLRIRPSQGEGEKTETDMTIIYRTSQLGGDFSVMQGTVGPKKLLPPHTHEHEDQVVFIISGELEFEVGGEGGMIFSAGPGDYVLKPRGISHGFWNNSETETVHYIELSGKDGFEKFVDARGKGILKWQIEANVKLGMHTHIHRIPVLLVRHGLNGIAAASHHGEDQK